MKYKTDRLNMSIPSVDAFHGSFNGTIGRLVGLLQRKRSECYTRLTTPNDKSRLAVHSARLSLALHDDTSILGEPANTSHQASQQ